jgi:hypothetical protein
MDNCAMPGTKTAKTPFQAMSWPFSTDFRLLPPSESRGVLNWTFVGARNPRPSHSAVPVLFTEATWLKTRVMGTGQMLFGCSLARLPLLIEAPRIHAIQLMICQLGCEQNCSCIRAEGATNSAQKLDSPINEDGDLKPTEDGDL